MSDSTLRLIFFLGFIGIFSALELLLPRRKASLSRGQRWPGALGLVVLGSALARLFVPIGLTGVAYWASEEELGILNAAELPMWLSVIVTLMVLDLAIWFQHLVTHKVPLFWRLHRVHHTDPQIDVMTALRFHPVEIVLSLFWKCIVIVALGAPTVAVLTFAIILNSLAQFNHSNIRLPKSLDRCLRWVIVTPDMHRIHHSVHRAEHDMNFGFCLSLWDRLFRTYKASPSAGHDRMTVGLEKARRAHDQRFTALILQPLKPRL